MFNMLASGFDSSLKIYPKFIRLAEGGEPSHSLFGATMIFQKCKSDPATPLLRTLEGFLVDLE